MLRVMTIVSTAIAKIQKKFVIGNGVGEAGRAADGRNVEDDDADDLAEPERDDGEVVALQAQRRNAHQQAGHGGRGGAGQQAGNHHDRRAERIAGRAARPARQSARP